MNTGKHVPLGVLNTCAETWLENVEAVGWYPPSIQQLFLTMYAIPQDDQS